MNTNTHSHTNTDTHHPARFARSPARLPAVFIARIYYPEGVITVAASGRDDGRWVSGSGFTSSNIGRCVDIYAPGDYIHAASMDGPDALQGMSGTSLACPLVAGVVAMYLHAYPFHTSVDVDKALKVACSQ